MKSLEELSKEELITIIRESGISSTNTNSLLDSIRTHKFFYSLECIRFPAFCSDDSGKILEYNNAFANSFNLPNNLTEPLSLQKILLPYIEEITEEELSNSLFLYLNDKILSFNDSANDEKFFQLKLSKVTEKGKNVFSGILFDITQFAILERETNRIMEELAFNRDLVEESAHELIELNTKLEESQEKLKIAVAEKDKFFSIIAHDLKSPFTALLGFSEILVEESDSLSREEIKEYSEYLRNAIVGLYKLLENLLTWSRLQRGKIEKHLEEIDLYELIIGIFSVLHANAEQKNITFKTNLESPFIITADKMMIETIIRNLISNALKFTNSGGTISVNVEKIEGFVKISVQDTGVGMSESIRKKLFKIDEHITTRGTNDEKGTGLGLILAKEFVEAHGGTISVTSKEGEGSTFTFTIAQPEYIQ